MAIRVMAILACPRLFAVTLLATTLTAVAPTASAAEIARGVVFDDRNGDGRRDADEPGIPNVAVSNGRQVVLTDVQGRYELDADDDTIFFVTKPTGWMTPTDENGLPRFHYIHKPKGSPTLRYGGVEPTGPLPESIDFPLTRRAEVTKFNVVAFGDPQPYNLQEVHWYGHDVVTEVIGVDAAFGMSLGDLVGDDLTLMQPLNEVTGRIGLPWYHVLGNHDINFDASEDKYSDETFERIYGPPYYSFDHGDVHFVVLNNVVWIPPEGEQRGRYIGAFGRQQLDWLREDLRHVPPEKLVVSCFHIPLPSCEAAERKAFLDLLADRPHQLSLAAHWHKQGQFDSSDLVSEDDPTPRPHNHDHFVVGTASGSWWRGMPDEYGIPHTQMRDGTPNGWLLISFDGPRYSWRYKAARRPWSHQMIIFAPDVVTPENSHDVEVVVNVFVGSREARVEMRVDDGEWKSLGSSLRPDPFYVATYEREREIKCDGFRVVPRPEDSTHLWVGRLGQTLSPGGHVIEVRVTDRFDQVHVDRRIIRVAN